MCDRAYAFLENSTDPEQLRDESLYVSAIQTRKRTLVSRPAILKCMAPSISAALFSIAPHLLYTFWGLYESYAALMIDSLHPYLAHFCIG